MGRMAGIMVALLLGIGCGRDLKPQTPAPSSIPMDRIGHPRPEWLARQGEVLMTDGDFIRAAQYFEAALDEGVEDRKIIALLIRSYIKAGRYTDAERRMQEYLEDHEDDAAARKLLDTIQKASALSYP